MAGASDTTRKKYSSYHRRNDGSGELDVFEAARYYSGQNDGLSSHLWRTRRMSLDEHVKQPSMFLPRGLGKQVDSSSIGSRNKHEQRQPRSPGGRLASFLNSLFSQSNSKKKASNKYGGSASSSVLQPPPVKEYEDPDQRRRRRSSMSQFRSSSSTNGVRDFFPINHNNKNFSLTSTTKSSYRQPDHASVKPTASITDKTKKGSGTVGGKSSLSESKPSDKVETRVSSTRFCRNLNDNSKAADDGCSKESVLVDREGEDSDSSSDLFELHIGGGSYCSSDLPVYETTRIERIGMRATPISLNAPS